MQTPNVEINDEYYKTLTNFFVFYLNLDFRQAALANGFLNQLSGSEVQDLKYSLLVPCRTKYAEFFSKVSYDFGMELIFMAIPYL